MKTKSILKGLAVAAMVTASAMFAGRAAAESATITYVESEPLTLQQNYQVGALVDFDLPENYRIVVNDQPVSVNTGSKVSYTFAKPGDYVVVTQRRSGNTWVPVSEARTTVVSQASSTSSSTTTTTTSTPGGTTVKRTTTTTSEPAATTTTTTSADGTTVRKTETTTSEPGTTTTKTVTFTEDKPITLSKTYTIGDPLVIEVPETVKTEYRFRINNEPVTYDVETRRINYTFSQAGDYEIVAEKREGTSWTPVYTTSTVVVEKQ